MSCNTQTHTNEQVQDKETVKEVKEFKTGSP